MIVGRATEQSRIDRFFRDVQGGRGGALVLRGVPGVGKTTLLHDAVSRFPDVHAVFVECVELDASLPFAPIRSIVVQLAAELPDLPTERAEMLRGVLEGGPGAPPDEVAAGAALLPLLSVAAADRPLVLVVDDAQWAGAASWSALDFIGRRLGDERVGILSATRDLAGGVLEDDVPTLHVNGLSSIDVALLLGELVTTRVAEELARLTDGNPLAALEMTSQLSAEQRRGTAPVTGASVASADLLRGFLRYTEPLDDAQRTVLMLAATEPTLEIDALRAGIGAARFGPDELAGLLTSGLVRVRDNRLVFRHPLFRSAVRDGASDAARRGAHRVAAACLDPSDVGRRAWHLAAAAGDGTDEDAASALEVAAMGAAAAGDRPAAAAMLQRAAGLSATRDDDVRRSVEAGRLLAAAGDSAAAVAILTVAGERCASAHDRDQILLDRAMPMIHLGEFSSIVKELDDAEARAGADDRNLAGMAALFSGYAVVASSGPLDARSRFSRARTMLGEAGNPAEVLAAGMLAFVRQQLGDPDALASLRHVAVRLREMGIGPHVAGFADPVANGLLWGEDFSAASGLLDELVECGRSIASVAMLIFSLPTRAGLYFRTGHWQAGFADAVESHELALATKPALAAYPLIERARHEAAFGQPELAWSHIEEAVMLTEVTGPSAWTWIARGGMTFVAMCAGDVDDVIAHGEWVDSWAEAHGMAQFATVPVVPDLVEAYVRVGRNADAQRLVDRLEQQGVATQGRYAAAMTSRCRGLVSTEYEDPFETALLAHEGLAMPFERARTQLLYAERLRRDLATGRAAPLLEEATQTFTRLGARPWLDRAEGELEACTGRARDNATGGWNLTPQEHRVATTVAQGLTNKETAAALFLSPRTVESHLSNIYRKLELRSRNELIRKMVAFDT